MVIRTSPKPGTHTADDAENIKEIVANINSGEELVKHYEEILGFIENTFILAYSTLKGLEGMSLSPEEVMERIEVLGERQGVVLKEIEDGIQRISELPDGSRAANHFNIALRDRMDAYGEVVENQLKKLGLDPQNM